MDAGPGSSGASAFINYATQHRCGLHLCFSCAAKVHSHLEQCLFPFA